MQINGTSYRFHHLVAHAFIEACLGTKVRVVHLDNNKDNNTVENLRVEHLRPYEPKTYNDGRTWQAYFTHNRKRYQELFSSKEYAQEFISQVVDGYAVYPRNPHTCHTTNRQQDWKVFMQWKQKYG